MKTGHIRIDKKVYFEYYELEKPLNNSCLNVVIHNRRIKEYKTSKRLVEVNNIGEKYTCPKCENFPDIIYPKLQKSWCIDCKLLWFYIKNNQPCKAEITGETCTIVELIK